MSIPDTTVRLLEAVSYFADLDADILQTIALRCQSKSLLSRRPVFMEGDPCKHLYILESGCVKFYRSRTSKAALGLGRVKTLWLAGEGCRLCVRHGSAWRFVTV